ncbi:MAG TPA: hypothetical protein VFV68_00315 [Agriterribacter sp.]|nr:hypothetical protein [Agriterribacter sp.]
MTTLFSIIVSSSPAVVEVMKMLAVSIGLCGGLAVYVQYKDAQDKVTKA